MPWRRDIGIGIGFTNATESHLPLQFAGLGGNLFNAGANPRVTLRGDTGYGSVVITFVHAPVGELRAAEPGSLALLAAALASFGLTRRGRIRRGLRRNPRRLTYPAGLKSRAGRDPPLVSIGWALDPRNDVLPAGTSPAARASGSGQAGRPNIRWIASSLWSRGGPPSGKGGTGEVPFRAAGRRHGERWIIQDSGRRSAEACAEALAAVATPAPR